jgi:ferritin-like metal-binding protein YciE
MAALKSLHDLFVHELKDIYSAEKQILRALPKMVKAASSEHLKASFEEHLGQTEEQVSRLEQVFAALDISARAPKCEGMAGLIEEGSKIMEEKAEPAVMDAALIAAAQKVEHYEIATYGTLVTWAHMLGEDKLADILHTTLDEEKETDQKLTELAESEVNVEAQG